MKKIFLATMFIASTAAFSFAQESFAYGIRAGFSYTMFKVNHHVFEVVDAKKPGDPVDPGLGAGFSLGAAFNIPIMYSLSFNPELNLGYRSLWWYDNRVETNTQTPDCPIRGSVGCLFQYLEYEFFISIPLMLKYIPIEEVPFYVATGVQFDFTPWAEETRYAYGKPKGFELKDREAFGIGIPISLGYHITKNFTADFRFVIGLSRAFSTEGDNRSFNQFGIGFTNFF